MSDATGVLIIEDSPVQAKIIRKQIEALTQFNCVCAYSLNEAADILKRQGNNFFIAIVDLNLPDAPDGEAADLCLASNLTTIVLTATFNEQLRAGFIDRRVADYFFKGSIDDMEPLVNSIERIYRNGKVKAMVVDDSKTQRHIIRHLLEVHRFTVLEAEDGIDALKKLKENPDITMIITDFQMPKMDGLELVREVRRKYRSYQLSIIGVSSAGSGSLTAQFLKNGANDFLTKPFEVEEFYWRVNQNIETLEVMSALKECRKVMNEARDS
ncbi:response regulator [Desulfovibrio litoralis]|uniref:Response regulator receiver domain-containing protein n=1 Tax=Desulfovibrio litoralis DSM 11393 TaxID=1121455 RepID=A0A1M7RWI4_9BACT|nr:response regulator [Desulfovibrio litoralis]SHN50484.1 Response regulator receiver domain-containing protein [Desulfovibrio litoralis DSM 11393]